MKKSFLILILLISLKPLAQVPSNPDSIRKILIGEWKEGATVSYTLESNGTFVSKVNAKLSYGFWEINEDIIKLSFYSKTKPRELQIVALTENTIIYKSISHSKQVLYYATKVTDKSEQTK